MSHKISAKISIVFPVISCPPFTSYSKAMMRFEEIAFRLIFFSIVSITDLFNSSSRTYVGIYLQYSLIQRETWLSISSSMFYFFIKFDNTLKIFIKDSGLRLIIWLNNWSDRFLTAYPWQSISYFIWSANSCMRIMDH